MHDWVKAHLWDEYTGRWDEVTVLRAGQYLRLKLGSDTASAATKLLSLIYDDIQGLDLVDFCLGMFPTDEPSGSDYGQWIQNRVSNLQTTLNLSGSAWTIGVDQDGLCLQRRVNDTAEKAARQEMAGPGRASVYLRRAWSYVYGRNPDAGAAYGDAIRAVEAAGRPVFTPKDHRATLGKMIDAVEAKQDKWTTEIGDVETVLKMMKAIWKSHKGRHGTDDETKPANVSQAQAEAAVQLAVTLVQLLRTQGIRVAVQ